MSKFKRFVNWTGLAVFAVTMAVYLFSAERTGSLWDCGEFILGAYKLQVVHPPGAPLFLITGRLFAALGDLLSNNPEHIAFAVNLMSAVFTALASMMIAWITMILGKLSLVGREDFPSSDQLIALAGAGLAAGLATSFSTSIWFSAVEGEVYAMSTFFSVLTFWAMVKWYHLPNEPKNDRWVIFSIYAAGLSLGVHLLSLLAFPVMALLYYFKKYDKVTPSGVIASFGVGVALIVFVQKVIIVGIPTLWSKFEIMMVNGMGLPFHTGIIPTALVLGFLVYFGLRTAKKRNMPLLQNFTVAFALLVISFMSMGTVMIRANANPPVNMNEPSDVMRLIPYLNREQYGERALLYGPTFEAKPTGYDRTKRYGRVGDRYEYTHDKVTPQYRDSDKGLFPRIYDPNQGRPQLYRQWINKERGEITLADNIEFFLRYQVGWMYIRYFMWNFSGRQNGEQGYYQWDPSSGNWISGITPIDEMRTHELSELPDRMKNNQARNKYFLIPFILGLIGLLYHARNRPREFYALLGLFFITGIGIILYTNQPPNEPRERDYVLVGSFFTYCVWIGMSVLAIYDLLSKKLTKNNIAALAASALVLTAPAIMAFQNFDDHSRMHHKASRDYASNFLNSVEENAVIFTYGDNDTYPLWYAQEVENIRPDVRVINLSLIAVDWYINQMRRRINDSPPLKFTVPREAYLGSDRNQVFYPYPADRQDPGMSALQALKFMGEDHPKRLGQYDMKTFLPSKNLSIPIDKAYFQNSGAFSPDRNVTIQESIPLNLGKRSYLTKDELAIMDIVASNINDRPIYFSVTCRPQKLLGLRDYTQLEGLALRVVPVKAKSRGQNLIYFYGDIDTEKMYDNVVNKWQWGNFDEKRLFVTSSYNATLQAMQLTMSRLLRNLIQEGKTEEAGILAEEYFTAFPYMNFKYNQYVVPFIEALMNAGKQEEAEKHLKLLAEEMQEYMEFYSSLSQEDLSAGYSREYQMDLSTTASAIQLANSLQNEELKNEIIGMLAKYQSTNLLRG